MLSIPDDFNQGDVVFGTIKHMPKFDSLPDEFRHNWSNQSPHCRAISFWFYEGCQFNNGKLLSGGWVFSPKPGVDAKKALRAISVVLKSFEPSHEHKIAACGFMFSEWFDCEEKKGAKQ